MYLKKFWIKDHRDNEIYAKEFIINPDKIFRWSVIQLDDPSVNLLVLKLIAVGLGGGNEYLTLIGPELTTRWMDPKGITWGIDFFSDDFKNVSVQFKTQPDGKIEPLWFKKQGKTGQIISKGFSDTKNPFGSFAYGCNLTNADCIALDRNMYFTPRARSTRFASLFANSFLLTPVDEWLYCQYLNASRYQSKRAECIYNTSLSLITAAFPNLSFSHWGSDKKIYFIKDSQVYPFLKLPFDYIFSIGFFIDIIRNIADSKRQIDNFHQTHGVLLINQVERLLPGQTMLALKTMAEFFANIQFIIASTDKHFVEYLQEFHLEFVPMANHKEMVKPWIITNSSRKKYIGHYKNLFRKSRFIRNPPASENSVVLVDVDSHIPNLALMKISKFYKEQGRQVVLCRDSSEHTQAKLVFASSIFLRNGLNEKIKKLKRLHGENLQIGGTGVDLDKKLPPEIESLMPDYSLYPQMDFALGFLTRGCPGQCKFCIVPKKEGNVKLVATLDDFVPPGCNKVVILDDNLLSFSGAIDILKQMVQQKLQVNFNQALDVNYLTPENSAWLVKVDSRNYSFTKRMYYFGLNTTQQVPILEQKLKLLKGLQMRQMIFICMYGYNTTLSQDIERFYFLYQHGLSPFVQKFQPVDNSAPPRVTHYFDTDIDLLLKIKYHFNGRNFENFLRWVSKKYLEEFGTLCMPLVDLIFKYNNRPYKHRYIETLAGTRK